MTIEELQQLMPSDKLETDKAEQLVALGYPTVEPVLEDMIMWSIDPQPVAFVFIPFLETLGKELVPALTTLLTGFMSDQDGNKSQILHQFVEPNEAIASEMHEVLMYLADANYLLFPKKTDRSFGNEGEATSPVPHVVSIDSWPSIVALEILIKYKLVEPEWTAEALQKKINRVADKMKELEEIKNLAEDYN